MKNKIAVTAALATLFNASSLAAEVTKISLNQLSGVITVQGTSFGQAPNVILFDTFDNDQAAQDSTVLMAADQIGSWTTTNQFHPTSYSNNSRSGGFSAKVFSGKANSMQQLQLQIPQTQEIYVSYWVRLDGSSYFPGDLVTAARTFSDDSSFKFLWLFDQDVQGKSSDVVLPSHVGKGNFYLAGNDFNMVTNIGNEWWSWDSWMKMSFWLKANPTDPTASGTVYFDTVSSEHGYKHRSYSVPVFDADGLADKVYRQMNFPGWVKSVQDANTDILYDDIYVSVGPNAAARLELGDAPNLSDVKRLDLLKINSWSDSQITANYPTVPGSMLNTMYLYVTTSDGKTSEKGIPVFNPPSTVSSILIK